MKRVCLVFVLVVLVCQWSMGAADGVVSKAGDTAGATNTVPRHGVALHGEPKYGPDFKHFDYVNPDAPKGGFLRLGVGGTFDSLNPFILRGSSAPGLGLCYDSLCVSSGDEPYSVYGLIAESIEFPKDRSWVVFRLRKEARWHDGKPITADDVVFTFNIRMKKGDPRFRFYYACVDSVEALGPHKVRFNIKPGKANHEIPLFISQMEILPKHYWESRDFAATTLKPPLGSGPYKLKSFEVGRKVEYERVKDYWGKDLPVRVGMFNFDRVRFMFYRDSTVELEAFKSGDYDWRKEYTAKIWARMYDTPEVKNGQIVKELFPHHRAGVAYGWVFNTRRQPFDDRDVRKALTYVFDFEWTNKKLFYSAYRRLRSYFDNTDLEAKGLPQGRELEILKGLREKYPDYVWPEIFEREFNPPSTPEWKDAKSHKLAMRKNLLEARRILRDAGWYIRKKDMKLVNDEVRDENGKLKPLKFEILLVQPSFEAITLPMVRTMKKLGIEVQVRTVESAQYSNRLKDFDFDCIVVVWPMSLCPGNEQFENWSTESADTRGAPNYAGIKSPAIDELLTHLVESDTRAELRAHVRALDRILQWGYYIIPAWGGGEDRIAYWNKLDHPRPDYVPIRGVSDVFLWWVDRGKEQRLKEMLRKKKQ